VSGHGFLTFLGPTACEDITDVLPNATFLVLQHNSSSNISKDYLSGMEKA